MKKLIYIIAGARPNFMKIAPIVRVLEEVKERFDYKIIHTGQHYDYEMSDVFFEELGIPKPNYQLDCGGGSHAQQTAKIIVAFDEICSQQLPDCVLVVGDVNSTLACSVVAKKKNIPLAHVESGLRSGDRSMPEEINRLVTDSITDWFFCTEPAAVENLLNEGKAIDNIFYVGHVMVDNLLYQCDKLNRIDSSASWSYKIKEVFSTYGVVTLHRPSNVDNKQTLTAIVSALNVISNDIPIIFPVHPRTRENLESFNINVSEGIKLCGPLPYMSFLDLWKDAAIVLTDSGGLQEETTALSVPCLTLRTNTERPVTLVEGTNTLVGTDPIVIVKKAKEVLDGKRKVGHRPKLWDGHAAERIVEQLDILLN